MGGRMTVQAAERLLGKEHRVLGGGFIKLVDYMGGDMSIVRAARVTTGSRSKGAVKDKKLITYLMRNRHTSPFEFCEATFHVRVPMDVWRQWVRHRTACLAGSTEIYFDPPAEIRRSGYQLYKLTIEEIWRRFQPTVNCSRPDKQRNPYFRRDRIRGMQLRQVDENTLLIQRTRVVDVFKNGPKQVFRMVLDDGNKIECTADHRFLFREGWKSLREGTGLQASNGRAIWESGDYEIYVNSCEFKGAPCQDKPWLSEQYNVLHRRARMARIVAFEYVGERETYDLEVEGPFHNFIANGIVTHNSINEYSTRYREAIDEAEGVGYQEWRLQAKEGNRQGSSGLMEAHQGGSDYSTGLSRVYDVSRRYYKTLLKAGVAREQARRVLPLATYTEAFWKIDLHNLLHFLRLRMHPHAQEEIRAYANAIAKIVAAWVPWTWEAFEEYSLGAVTLSKSEVDALKKQIGR